MCQKKNFKTEFEKKRTNNYIYFLFYKNEKYVLMLFKPRMFRFVFFHESHTVYIINKFHI